jgi:hypothetical protein
MPDPEREAILQRDRVRKAKRQSLLTDVERAKHDLHPRTIGSRWTAMQKRRISETAASAKQNIAKNAPLVGIAGLAVLLFVARKPISQWMQRLRDRGLDGKGEEQ